MSEKTYHTSIIYYTRNTYCDLSHLASVAILLRSFLTCPSCSSLGGVCTGGMNTVFPLWYENGQGILGILRLLHHLSLWQNEIYTFQRPCLNHEKIWTLFTSFSPPWWLWPPSKRIPKGWLPLLLPKLWGRPKMDKVVEKRLVFVHMTWAFTFACLAALDSNSHAFAHFEQLSYTVESKRIIWSFVFLTWSTQ